MIIPRDTAQGLLSRALVVQDRKRRSLEAQLRDGTTGFAEQPQDDFAMQVAKKTARRRARLVPQLLADAAATVAALQELRSRVVAQGGVARRHAAAADDNDDEERNDDDRIHDDDEDEDSTEVSGASSRHGRGDLAAVARDFERLGLGALAQTYVYDPRDVGSANDVLALSSGAWVDGTQHMQGAPRSAWDPNWGRPTGFTGLLFLSPHGVPILVGDGQGDNAGSSSLRAVGGRGGDLWFQVRAGRGAAVLLRASMLRGLKGSRACAQMAADLAVTHAQGLSTRPAATCQQHKQPQEINCPFVLRFDLGHSFATCSLLVCVCVLGS